MNDRPTAWRDYRHWDLERKGRVLGSLFVLVGAVLLVIGGAALWYLSAMIAMLSLALGAVGLGMGAGWFWLKDQDAGQDEE